MARSIKKGFFVDYHLLEKIEKAVKTGASAVYVEDLKEEFVTDFIFPAFKANAIYEGRYLLGTALAAMVLVGSLLVGDSVKATLNNIVLRLLATMPPGKATFTIMATNRPFFAITGWPPRGTWIVLPAWST